MTRVPDVVRRKALDAGAAGWLDDLPALVASLERDWSLAVGRSLTGGHEAFVAEATLAEAGDDDPDTAQMSSFATNHTHGDLRGLPWDELWFLR